MRARISAWANKLKSLKKSHARETEFQPRLKSKLGCIFGAIYVYLKPFVCNIISGAEANISAQAEIRPVIGTKFQPPSHAEISAQAM